MCLAMNADQLEPGERCASTSNRNFEGARATAGARTCAAPPCGGGGGDGPLADVRTLPPLQPLPLPRATPRTSGTVPSTARCR
jgi:hypothetical protein